ncbi:MAG: DUF4301 family protein [Prevotellaceae bacterium]|jgi:hypothetical protein|nr:DUF4301 family protein [Prevotellaceae bacterium]
MITNLEFKKLAEKGVSQNEIEKQIANFVNGFPFLHLEAPATVERGLKRLSPSELDRYAEIYDCWTGSRIKFVPASGAASRMFKALYEALNALETSSPCDEKSTKAVDLFFDNLNKFAFGKELSAKLKSKNIEQNDRVNTLHTFLDVDGMNYGNSPKGLLLFHLYPEGPRTAFEEHLVEAALYGKRPDGTAELHFTVSPEHRDGFEKLMNEVKSKYEEKYKVKLSISFSEQKKSTDTIAVDLDNKVFRNADGSLLFRPAGHGALLENLNELEAELVFIKNIDNVTVESRIGDTVKTKKALAGLLLDVRRKVCDMQKELEITTDMRTLERIADFMDYTFCISVEASDEIDEFKRRLAKALNRPMRVCGMVKNEGEPGGGPFVACDSEKRPSPQIAESSQIDMNNPQQKAIFASSTHFNPVDLVCCLRDTKGEKFNLLDFRDPETGFISVKTKDGRELKAQELPGLWNGAMSNWNTIFVETPLSTFNPVKTVNDLLKKEHASNIETKPAQLQ